MMYGIDHAKMVDKAVNDLLQKEWEVRETKTAFRICVVGTPDSAGCLASITIREGKKDLQRAIAYAIASLPKVIIRGEEAIRSVDALMQQQPKDMCIPITVAAFLTRIDMGGDLR
jgi:hypothetical protein